jgi:hypothetical protein
MGHSAAGRVRSIENSIDLHGKRNPVRPFAIVPLSSALQFSP